MEKLIELLNEYGDIVNLQYYLEDGKIKIARADNYTIAGYIDLEIISKKFGFIKRLVENDKIDLEKIGRFKAERKNTQIIAIANKSDFYLSLLMLLSISDTPIELLISILK